MTKHPNLLILLDVPNIYIFSNL